MSLQLMQWVRKKYCSKNNRKKADYVLALEDNQKNFHNDVKDYFETALKDKTGDFIYEESKKSELGHGRIETRTHYFSKDIEWLSMKEEWRRLKSIGMVVRKSIEGDVEAFAKAVREHWGIEAIHWNLDVTFLEDKMHSRKDYLPENLAILKKNCIKYVKAGNNN